MRVNIILTLIFIVLCSIYCCEGNSEDKGRDGQTGLTGKWQWEKSYVGFAGICTTPDSIQNEIIVEFTPDSVFKRYKDNLLVSESHYSTVKGKSIYSDKPAQLIQYENDLICYSFLFLDKNHIELKDECFDCFQSIYERIE